LLFSLLALVTALASLLWGPMLPLHESWLAAALIFFLGVPHGALDPLFAAALLGIKSPTAWLGFSLFYVLLAAAVVLLWWTLPAVFLTAFLAVSVLHFSGDPSAGASFLERLVYGTAVIALPAGWHAAEMLRLFSLLVGPAAAQPVVTVLQLIAWPCLLALLGLVALSALRRTGRDGWRTLEFLALGGLAWTATPLLGFSIYFCAMHSARHILRTQQFTGVTPSRLALVAALPMLALLGLGLIGWTLWPASPTTLPAVAAMLLPQPQTPLVTTHLLQLLFVGLAALTLPHMLLVERLRWTGWQLRV
jgi:Brp/Blh family beta-carotene 15,15'-monooxygenase